MNFYLQIFVLPVLTLPLLNIAILPSLSQTEQLIAQKVNCNNPQTTVNMRICADREYQTADKKLNQIYRQLQAKLSRNQKQRMTNAQLAWIKFRDANCDYERGQFEGGTMASHIGISCLADMTEKRTKELQEYLQDTNR